jgi:pimeloyl-ACP methyl ester carboxylesterase
MLVFQLPTLPEAFLRAGNWRPLSAGLRISSAPGTFSDQDLGCYREAWSQPGALKAMVNWYRAALRIPPKPLQDRRVHVPTLLIWGAKDRFLGEEMAQPSLDLCDSGRLLKFPAATHWVQHERPEEVNQALLAFLSE